MGFSPQQMDQMTFAEIRACGGGFREWHGGRAPLAPPSDADVAAHEAAMKGA